MTMRLKPPKQRVGTSLAETEEVVDSARRAARQVDALHRNDVDPALKLIEDGWDEEAARFKVKQDLQNSLDEDTHAHNKAVSRRATISDRRADEIEEMLADSTYYTLDHIYRVDQKLEFKCIACGLPTWYSFWYLQHRKDNQLSMPTCTCQRADARQHKIQNALPDGWKVTDVPRNIQKPMKFTCPNQHTLRLTNAAYKRRVKSDGGKIVCKKCARPAAVKGAKARFEEMLMNLPAKWMLEGDMVSARDPATLTCPNGHELNLNISNFRARLKRDGAIVCKKCESQGNNND